MTTCANCGRLLGWSANRDGCPVPKKADCWRARAERMERERDAAVGTMPATPRVCESWCFEESWEPETRTVHYDPGCSHECRAAGKPVRPALSRK